MSGRDDGAGPLPAETAARPRVPGARPAAPRGSGAPGPVSSFLRYAACGGGVTLLSSWALVLLASDMGLVAANALVTVLGTLLSSELHGRVSFKSERRGWRMHGESALTALGAYLVTTGSMLALHHLADQPSGLTGQAVYIAASGAAGVCRFLVLRLVVFGRHERGRRSGEKAAVVLAA